MSQLFTLPPVLPKQQLTKREAGVPDLSTLRGKQVEVTDGILSILTNTAGGSIIVLEGVAGAGKTFITSRIIEQLLHIKWDTKIAFSATTNRAVTVSFQSTAFYSPMLEFSTIHKLLALKEVILPDGTLDFYPDKFAVPAISNYKIVFIDECSQFSRKLWGYLLPYIDAGLKVVLIGDPCFAKGTEIRMFDGSIKRVEEVAVGDSIMGADSTKRTVLRLFHGHSVMYDIKQSNGDTYRVTPLHKISMVRRETASTYEYKRYPELGDYIEVTAADLANKSAKFLEVFAGYKHPIHFTTKPVLIDPYYLGLWLGDGEATSTRISNPDIEVVEFCKEYAKMLRLKCFVSREGSKDCFRIRIVKHGRGNSSNFLLGIMREYNVISNKHVPCAYMVNSADVRLRVLAGLLDSDGHYDAVGHRFTFSNICMTLVDDVVMLCRSLGLKAEQHVMSKHIDSHNVRDCYVVNISGDIHRIPTKVGRKIAPHKKAHKNLSYSTLSATPVIVPEEYFGFELDGDNKFLLADFTVAHNCQTPPVKEADSLVFNAQMQKEHHMHVFKLTEIVRQAADNPIIGVTSFIRENIDKHIDLGHLFDYEDDLWQGDKGVYFMRYFNAHDRAYFDELLKHIFCSPNFVADTNFAKVVCWRNKTVRALNKGIRKMIYGTKQLRRIEPGEKIIAKAPVFDLAYQTVLVNNGTQMEVIDFEKQVEHINEGMYTLYYYDTKIRYYDMRGNEVVKRINIPTDKGIKVFNEVSEILASAAKTYKPGTFQAKSAWADFWKFQKTYANIQHDYAGTVHAIQGSSVTNTVVMSNDILGNPKIVERNKILYTGATRAVERLFVI